MALSTACLILAGACRGAAVYVEGFAINRAAAHPSTPARRCFRAAVAGGFPKGRGDPAALRSTSSDAPPATAAAAENVEGGDPPPPAAESDTAAGGDATTDGEAPEFVPPWTIPSKRDAGKANKQTRFRQHVNPLARRYQMNADLPDGWPGCVYDDASRPLYLDIGCGKGGFLLDMVSMRHGGAGGGETAPAGEGILPSDMNYLGLEIRPSVAQYAQERVERRLGPTSKRLSFVGCNANVDLDRMLGLYQSTGDEGQKSKLVFASIQYPDPHFKKQHAKRRVVTKELISIVAKHMDEGAMVFLQSDVKDVLDDMRDRFREHGEKWFADQLEDAGEYLEENPLGVPTEREVSVLKKDLPVYRALFRRNDAAAVLE